MGQVIQLIDSLVWPLTVLVIVLLFRRELRQASTRLSSLSYKDLRAEFDRELTALEGDVHNLPGPAAQKSESVDLPKSLTSYDSLMRIADISPRAAIMEAWRDIEITTKKIANFYELAPLKDMPGIRNVRQLIGRGILPTAAEGLFERMRRLRSKAAHATDFAIEPDDAQRYIDTALELQNALQFALKNAQRVTKKKG